MYSRTASSLSGPTMLAGAPGSMGCPLQAKRPREAYLVRFSKILGAPGAFLGATEQLIGNQFDEAGALSGWKASRR